MKRLLEREFLLTIAAFIVSAAWVFVTPGGIADKGIGIVAAALTSAGYAVSRGIVKRNQPTPPTPPAPTKE